MKFLDQSFKGPIKPFLYAFENLKKAKDESTLDATDGASSNASFIAAKLRVAQMAYYQMTSDRNTLEACLSIDESFLALMYQKASLQDGQAHGVDAEMAQASAKNNMVSPIAGSYPSV